MSSIKKERVSIVSNESWEVSNSKTQHLEALLPQPFGVKILVLSELGREVLLLACSSEAYYSTLAAIARAI